MGVEERDFRTYVCFLHNISIPPLQYPLIRDLIHRIHTYQSCKCFLSFVLSQLDRIRDICRTHTYIHTLHTYERNAPRRCMCMCEVDRDVKLKKGGWICCICELERRGGGTQGVRWRTRIWGRESVHEAI